MSSSETAMRLEDHGTTSDADRGRIKCNYCRKEVSGASRFKHHLSGVGSDVAACQQVPEAVRTHFWDELFEKKKGKMIKEMGSLTHADLLRKRSFSPSAEPPHLRANTPSTTANEEDVEALCKNGSSVGLDLKSSPRVRLAAEASATKCEPSASKKGKEVEETAGGSDDRNCCYLNLSPSRQGKQGGESAAHVLSDNACHASSPSTADRRTNIAPPIELTEGSTLPLSALVQGTKPVVKSEKEGDLDLFVARLIGKFIFEAGLDPDVVKLPSFKDMIDSVLAFGAKITIPTYDTLRSTILQQELKEIRQYAESLEKSWHETGCSILLDSWKDRSGRSLMSCLVQCPSGTLFLRSMDMSGIIDDVDDLAVVLSKIVEDVGAKNVVQVITNDASPYMQAAQHQVMKKYPSVFWTLCADFCIDLVLKKIAEIDYVKAVLTKIKDTTSFIYSHALPLELKSQHIQGQELVSSSNLKYVAQFVTLDTVLSERLYLVQLFKSDAWNTSNWASTTRGSYIAELIINDDEFWQTVDEINKVTDPLIGVLDTLEGQNCPMAVLYEAIDSAKEHMKHNLGHQPKDIWKLVDYVWDNYIHSPLHGAGYYLNPRIFYLGQCDDEVQSGMEESLKRMAGDQQEAENLLQELNFYKRALGSFGERIAIERRAVVSQADWWSLYGNSTPGLRQVAFKIFNQPCCGASRYNLEKDFTEQLHFVKRSYFEQQIFSNMEYVYYNRLLQRSVPNFGGTGGLRQGKQIQLGDWIAENCTNHTS